jgi:hypothetical protein
VVGAVPIIGFALVVAYLVGPLGSNEAEESLSPITDVIEDDGGTRVCSDGDGGHFINQQPWYQVVYRVPSDAEVRTDVLREASLAGFELREVTDPQLMVGNVLDYSSTDDASLDGLQVSVSQGAAFSVTCASGERDMSTVDGAAVYSFFMLLQSDD